MVGAGLFGSIIGKTLESKGLHVTYIDSGEKRAGSRPAGCLMKPSWMKSVSNVPECMDLLGSLYDVKTLAFKASLLSVNCSWVDPLEIMSDSRNLVHAKVLEVKDGEVVTEDKTYKGLVIVAAGVWTKSLLPQTPGMQALCGSAVLGTGKVKNTIHIIGPYKQAVWFNMGKDRTWFGDGTSIIEKNFSLEHQERTKERALTLAGIEGRMRTGARPYLKGGKLGLFEKLGSRLFVSSGGAKNGTILAAEHAVRLLKMI